MICYKCGNEISEDSIFCKFCGTKMTEQALSVSNANNNVLHESNIKEDTQSKENKVKESEDVAEKLINEEPKEELIKESVVDNSEKLEPEKEGYIDINEDKETSVTHNIKENNLLKNVNSFFQKKINIKKPSKRVIIIMLAVVFIGIAIYAMMPTINYALGKNSLKAKEYEKAVEYFIKAGSTKDAQKQLEISYYYIGKQLFDEKKYDDAIEYFSNANSYKEADTKIKESNYYRGKELFNQKSYNSAVSYFKNAKGYSDSKEMLNASMFLDADNQLAKGISPSAAKKLYNAIPKDYSYKGDTVSERLDYINKFVKLEGTYHSTSSYAETKQTHIRTGIWNNWYWNDMGNTNLNVSVMLYQNGKAKIDISGSYYRCTDFSSISDYNILSSHSFSVIKTVKDGSIPISYKPEENTSLTYANGVFNLNYSEKDHYSSYFVNTYIANVTYKK